MKGEDTDRQQFMTRVISILGYERYEEVVDAYQLFKAFHAEDLRADGARYVTHPRAAAEILLDFGPSSVDEIVTSLLHDVIEDKFILPRIFRLSFSERIAQGLVTLTKYDVYLWEKGEIHKEKLPHEVYYDRIAKAEHFVRRVKLADRLHNLRTMEAMPPEKRRDKVEETYTWVMAIALATDKEMAGAILRQCKEIESSLQ